MIAETAFKDGYIFNAKSRNHRVHSVAYVIYKGQNGLR